MATARDDQSLWPPLKAIYDLTLTFENTILDILPDGILLLLSPVVLLHYLNKPVHVRQSPLLWIKLIVSVALVGTEIASLIFRAVSGNYRTETALPAASLELLAVITISIVVYVEHRHAIRGSALLGVYLFFGVIADIINSRSFFLRPGLAPMGALAVASGVLRIILLGLQEVPKTQLLLDRQLQSTVGREATSGYWNRSFFVHLYPLLLSGFRGVLVLSDLSNLGPDFAAELLYTQLKQYWKQARQVSRNALFVSCICTWKILFAAIILPRLAQSGFSLAQPFILYRAITVVGDDNVGNFERVLLLLGTILSFGGATMSKTTTSHLHNRLVTRIRGALVAQMFDKSLRVSQSETKKSAAITLMSADIEGIADGLPKLYELVMTLVDLGLGIFVLSLFVGKSCFVVLAPLAVSAIATYFLGNWIGAAFVSWNKSIETRVSKTSKVIDQLKAIKMFGLNPIVSDYLHNFRELEMASSNKFRSLEAVAVVSVLCAEYLTPVVVIAAALFWNTFGGKMSAATVFPSLSMIVLIKDPLSLLLDGYPVLKAMFGCFRRIQEFLNLEERKDPRILRESPSPTAEGQLLGYESPPLPIVEFSRAKIAPVGTQIPILNDIDFVLMPGSMTGVVGANGSGKSLLLQGILGEAELMDGNIYIGETDIALCGQTVWLRNGSLRDNIIGPLPYDEVLFRKVLRCCLLDQDIEQLPGGADYVVGSGGSRLSGGQRQRVGLARTLYARKALVLLDDVFSSLDRRTAISILFRLCGEDGFLRELNCAVVFCTYLPECQDVADQLIVLDGNGHATVDIKSNREARMEMIRSLDSGKTIVTEEDEAQEQEKIRLSFEQQPEPAAGPADPAKETPPKADRGLYWLFIKPMGGFNVLLWSFTMLLASVGEMAPDVYMRLWIERDPENDLYFIGYAAIAFLAVIIFVVGAAWMFVRLMPRASITLHQQLVDTVLRGTIGFLGTIDNGVIINRFSQDMTLMARALVLNFLRTISVFFTALIQAGIIASGSSYMAIILPIIAVAVFFIQLFYLRTSRQIRIFDLERKSPLYTHFQESSEGLIHIRAFGWQKQNLEHAFKLLDDSQKAFYYMYCVQLWLGLVLGLLSTLIAAILMAAALFATKSTSETALGLSFLNLILFAKTMEQLLKTWTRLELAVGALARLRDFMSTTPQESEQGRIPVPGNWPSMGNIELSGVTARYSDDEQRPATLKNISLSIDAGQKVGIVGRTGSGKSSLFLLLLGFLRYEGTMKVDGISISSIPVDELRSRIVTISQDQLKLEASARVNLLPFTLNLSPTVTDEKKRQEAERQDIRLRELLIRLGIWTPLNNKGGLDAMLDDVGYSHGQMQLFCLARGILRCQDTGSKVVLVDEATSSVEEEMERNAQRVTKEYFADCTVLVIGHRKSSIRGVEFTVELSKGEVVHVDPNALDSDEGDFR